MLIKRTLLKSVHADSIYIKFYNRENWSTIYSGKKSEQWLTEKVLKRNFWDDANIQYLGKGLG